MDWRLGDRPSLTDQAQFIDELVQRMDVLFKSLDASLHFTVEPMVETGAVFAPPESNAFMDLRGVGCPLNFVKAKLALEKIEVGQSLEILLDEGDPIENVPASFTQQGQEIISAEPVDDHHRVVIRRAK